MSEPLPISVVIPAYEAAASLADAIASVRAQTRAPSEIVVVDDGSRDATAGVARAFGATVISQANAGVAAARNAGIRMATQPWIALLDADDRWLPDKLEAQWDALQRSGDALCATNFAFVHPGSTQTSPAVEANRGYARVSETLVYADVVHLPRETLARALAHGMFLLPSTLLFERRLVTEHAEWFMERAEFGSSPYYHLPEDAEWFLRVLKRTDVVLVKRVLTEYRVLPGSLSSSAGRMRYGDVKLGELVCAEPGRYAIGSAAELRSLRAPRLREAVLAFLRQLEFEAASVVAREAYAGGRRPLDAILWAFARAMNCAVGKGLARGARHAWRNRLKPAVAPRRTAQR